MLRLNSACGRIHGYTTRILSKSEQVHYLPATKVRVLGVSRCIFSHSLSKANVIHHFTSYLENWLEIIHYPQFLVSPLPFSQCREETFPLLIMLRCHGSFSLSPPLSCILTSATALCWLALYTAYPHSCTKHVHTVIQSMCTQ